MQPFSPTLDNLSAQWKAWKEQFSSYLIATGLDKAPKEKQLAIFLQRFGTDRPRILPPHTGNSLKPAPLPLQRSHHFPSLQAAKEKKVIKVAIETSLKNKLPSEEHSLTVSTFTL